MSQGIYAEANAFHAHYRGKIALHSKVPLDTQTDLSLAYTPGVAQPCLEIARDRETVYTYTAKSNLVAIVSDGTAVLGLGDIGPHAAIPVMEGKAILFKRFGGIDAWPICIDSSDVDAIVETVRRIAPVFGGINLEDISAPRCFEVEERLKQELDIPVFHDDQHGTAVVVLAGVLNAVKVIGKSLHQITAVISGAGAAGVAVTHLLQQVGIGDVIVCDRAGALYAGRKKNMTPQKEKLAQETNQGKRMGSIHDVLEGADLFIGLSQANLITRQDVQKMAKDPMVFGLANPTPEIMPDEARAGGAAVICTGRSDFPNQINNVLAFPGIFRGALDVRASTINEPMKLAAAYALAEIVTDRERSSDYVIPYLFNPLIALRVAQAVGKAAQESGVAKFQEPYVPHLPPLA